MKGQFRVKPAEEYRDIVAQRIRDGNASPGQLGLQRCCAGDVAPLPRKLRQQRVLGCVGGGKVVLRRGLDAEAIERIYQEISIAKLFN